jgi:hypothetical protein
VLDSSRIYQEGQRLSNRGLLEGLEKLFSKLKVGKADRVPDPVAPPHPDPVAPPPVAPPHPPPTGGELPTTGPPREPDPSQPQAPGLPANPSSKWKTAKNVALDVGTGTAGTMTGLEIYGKMQGSEANSTAQAEGADSADPTTPASSTNPTDQTAPASSTDQTDQTTPASSTDQTDQTNPTNPTTGQTYNYPNYSPNSGLSNRALGHGEELLSLFSRMLDELD